MAAPSPATLPSRVLHWFRNDLRLGDNPGVLAASETKEAIFLFIDEMDEGLRPRGGASRWWLHHSLDALAADIAARGGWLILARGNSSDLVPEIAQALGCGLVTWCRRYGAPERQLDARIKATLRARGLAAQSFNGNLLYEPMEIRTKAGGPMRVFTPFWRACRALREPYAPIAAPKRLPPPAALPDIPGVTDLVALGFLPFAPDWSGGLAATWQPGEAGALDRLDAFLDGPLDGYAANRDRPDIPSTSMLSPHLAFGEISPRVIWHTTRHRANAGLLDAGGSDIEKFFAELGWREFSHHLLFHFPDLARKNHQPRFDGFPWRHDPAALNAWQRGLTGYPLVDAGLRELWQTGYMHNRVRMVVASFLIKHLLIDWREGEAWFWDTLCDADAANNPASWQWVAGSGADAAPYFRIFNPFGQGEKFDPAGSYVRRFVPELARLPDAFIHQPWEASPAILAKAGVTLGLSYPRPIVRHEMARTRALDAFKALGTGAISDEGSG